MRSIPIVIFGIASFTTFILWNNYSNDALSPYLAIEPLENRLRVPSPFLSTKALEDKLHASICKTSSRGREIILGSLLGTLFREGTIPPGSVLDVGAQFGEQACHYAVLAPDRTVYALDPSPKNVESIKNSKFGGLPNLRVMQAGVGRQVGVMKARDKSFEMPVGEEFKIETLDSLFYDKAEPLGLAHIDVEGLELDVLHGATKTLVAYSPIFTVEVRVHQDPKYTTALIDYIHELGYDPYIIDEVVGYPHSDFRNLLAIPRKKAKELVFSDAFNILIASEAIKGPVVSKDIFDRVLPCCTLGGECCPSGKADDKECCSEGNVKKWLDNKGVTVPDAMRGFKSARQVTLKRWQQLNKRLKLSVEEAQGGKT